jgi:hypothetical protein
VCGENIPDATEIWRAKSFTNASREGDTALDYTRRPRLPPGRRVPSWGIGVTSSILPILKPARASIRIAAWAPGPGVLALWPPGALTLMWSDVMPLSLATRAAAPAACIAA